MTDDFLSRAYVDNRRRMNAGIGRGIARLIATVRVSLDRLHRYEFDAPWRHRRC